MNLIKVSSSGVAADVAFTPAGTIAATNAQDAIEEVAAEAGGALDPTLTAWGGVTFAADTIGYATGADAFSTTPFTAAARTVLDDTTVAAMLATMGGAPLASPTFTGTVNGAAAIWSGSLSAANFRNGIGTDNLFAGTSAGNASLSGAYNVFLGNRAGLADTSGLGNIAVGVEALTSNTTGNFNIAGGLQALGSNTSGGNNVAFGYGSLLLNISGGQNLAIGSQSLGHTTGSSNTAIGYGAGDANTTGSNNTFIGSLAGLTSSTGLTNATAIGYDAQVTASNTIVLGNASVTAVSTVGAFSAASLNLGGATQLDTLRATKTEDVGSIAAGATATFNVTVTGAADGDDATVAIPAAAFAAGVRAFQPTVTAADTVTVTLYNPTGSPVDPASGTYAVVVRKF